ncbi:MAG: small multi-drug export protein [Hadesarchaea archaeon]|nr:small multi-drug export protein [Hadesarchaea archaeon]
MKEILVILTSLIPSFEARYAIPVALELTNINLAALFTICVALNIGVIPIVFLGLDWLAPPFRRKFKWVDSIFRWFWRRGRNRKWGFLSLVAFVATPIPGTGAYTGVLMAYLFGFDRKLSTIAIATGVIVSATLTTLATLGMISLVKSFYPC